MSQILRSNTKRSNPFTHRICTYTFKEVGNKKNPWETPIDLVFGKDEGDGEKFDPNGEGAYIKMLSIDVPTNVIAPHKYTNIVNWFQVHIDELKKIDKQKVSLDNFFQLNLIPFRVDYSLLIGKKPKFLLKDQGKREYDDYNQDVGEVPLFSYSSLDPIYSRPILTPESAKLLTTLKLKTKKQWSSSISKINRDKEFLDDESIFEENTYTSENLKKPTRENIELQCKIEPSLLSLNEKLINFEIVPRNPEISFLVNNKSKHEFMYIYQLAKYADGVKSTNKSLQLLSPLAGYKYNRTDKTTMPYFFEPRNGPTGEDNTTLSIARNIVAFYLNRQQHQDTIDNNIKSQKKKVEEPLITYKTIFTQAGKSFKDTKLYKDFIAQNKGNYPFDYKILMLYHIRPYTDDKQDFSSKYPTIEMRRIIIIKHFEVAKKKEHEGTVFAVPSYLIPSFRKVFPPETGFELSKDPTVYRNFKRLINLKKSYTLGKDSLTKVIEQDHTFIVRTDVPKDTNTPTIYIKSLDNEPDIVPFAYSNSQFWHIIQRTHSIIGIDAHALKLLPSSRLDNNLSIISNGNMINIDNFANKTAAADAAIIPDNSNNSYTFKRGGVIATPSIEYLSPTITTKLNTFNLTFLHGLELILYTNFTQRILHTEDQQLYSPIGEFSVSKHYRKETDLHNYYRKLVGTDFYKIDQSELQEAHINFSRLNSADKIRLEYDKGVTPPDLPFKNLKLVIAERKRNPNMRNIQTRQVQIVLNTQQEHDNHIMHFRLEQTNLDYVKHQLALDKFNIHNSKLYLNIKNILMPTAIEQPKTLDTIYITSNDIYSEDNHIFVDSANHKTRRSVLATINFKDEDLTNKKDKNDSASIIFSSLDEADNTKGHIAEFVCINNLDSLIYFTVYLRDENFEEVKFQNKKFPIRITLEIHNVIQE